jgi:hypothetical protein
MEQSATADLLSDFQQSMNGTGGGDGIAECVDIKASHCLAFEAGTESDNPLRSQEFLWANSSDLTSLPAVMGLFALVYSAIVLTSVLGNLLVILSVCQHRSLQSVRNLFIVSLSVSDIVISIVSGTITVSIFKYFKLVTFFPTFSRSWRSPRFGHSATSSANGCRSSRAPACASPP